VLLAPATSLAVVATLYEDWQEGIIRSARWQGGEAFGGLEISREVTASGLEMRYRHRGTTASNSGNTSMDQFLNVASPASINGIQATFKVTDLDMNVCAANNSAATTRARPARLLIQRFNDGTQSVPGDRTGDVLAGVQAYRDGSSANPAGVLNVQGFVIRCTNASCSTNTSIAGTTLATTVSVGQTFTLRLRWDQANHRFWFGLDGGADVAMNYAASDTAPANVPFVNLDVSHTAANCTAAPVDIDSTTVVGAVHTLAVGSAHDFNGDTRADILWRHTSGTLAGWLVNGTAVVGSGLLGSIAPAWSIAAITDFDANGKVDVLWRHSSGSLALWFMNGLAVASSAFVGSVPLDWAVAGVGDFNADGSPDILWRHSSGTLALWLMNGPAVISSAVLGSVGADWTIARLADFNGDGKVDILWRHSSGALALWLMNGPTIVSSASVASVGADWTIAGSGDFNGNGTTDLLWRHSSGALFIWFMNGATIAATAALGSVPADWVVHGVRDFNGDGKADILWRQTSTGSVAAWLMNGAAVLGTGTVGSATPDWQIQ
jgi:hypothetical protein